MRTQEKFYENLKKRHVSLEKRIERFEFRDVKTLDAFVTESKSLESKISKAYKKWKENDGNLDGMIHFEELLQENKAKQIKERDSNKKKFEAAMADDHKRVVDTIKEVDKQQMKVQDAKVLTNESEQHLIQISSQGEDFVDKFITNIKHFEASARGMGVYDKVSSLIATYKTAVTDLKAAL